jgi:tetratricopeptide (TPR) repeat protein
MRPSPGSTGPFGDTPLKWVGVVTALLCLLLLLNQAAKVFAEIRDRQRQVGELQAMADQQARAGEYQEAWASLERAATTTGRGSYLSRLASRPEAERQAIRTAQEDLAMAWLERASAPGGTRFSDTVDPLLPALTLGADAAAGRRKADLLAHVGWAHFLKSRDGADASDPEAFYRQALQADPSNPYAHAHWGHWVAWTRRPLDEAAAHFDAALASGRARDYVRSLQLAALQLATAAASQAAYLGAVADMVRNQEPVEPAVRNAVYALYARAFDDDARFDRLVAAVPPAAQIAVIRALFFDVDFAPARVPLRDASLARLQAASGDAAAALATWRSVAAALPPGAQGAVAERARAALAAAGPALLR